MSTPLSHQPVPYQEITEPYYAVEVARTHSLDQAYGDDYVLICTCPRCGAALDIELFDPVYKAASTSAPPNPNPTGAREVPVSCVCRSEHDGRPEGRTGCGAYWPLELS
ncbi:hypothetical protein [Streptomyces sp. NBC_00691]|uniref:hypothetical protein n=1 Tax=Streptomyces sp. NBC_00691 TaxID=2903671 RepID=UPI002E332435|nr:hypothetical protein [Streptomyces sp. NBC_00691]